MRRTRRRKKIIWAQRSQRNVLVSCVLDCELLSKRAFAKLAACDHGDIGNITICANQDRSQKTVDRRKYFGPRRSRRTRRGINKLTSFGGTYQTRIYLEQHGRNQKD